MANGKKIDKEGEEGGDIPPVEEIFPEKKKTPPKPPEKTEPVEPEIEEPAIPSPKKPVEKPFDTPARDFFRDAASLVDILKVDPRELEMTIKVKAPTVEGEEVPSPGRWSSQISFEDVTRHISAGLNDTGQGIQYRLNQDSIISFVNEIFHRYTETGLDIPSLDLRTAYRGVIRQITSKIAQHVRRDIKDAGYKVLHKRKEQATPGSFLEFLKEKKPEPSRHTIPGVRGVETPEELREFMGEIARPTLPGVKERKPREQVGLTYGDILSDFFKKQDFKYEEENDTFAAEVSIEKLPSEVQDVVKNHPAHGLGKRWHYRVLPDGRLRIVDMIRMKKEEEEPPFWKRMLGVEKEATMDTGIKWAGPSFAQIAALIGTAEAKWASELVGALSAKFAYSFPSMPGLAVSGPATEEVKEAVLGDENVVKVKIEGVEFSLKVTKSDKHMPIGNWTVEVSQGGIPVYLVEIQDDPGGEGWRIQFVYSAATYTEDPGEAPTWEEDDEAKENVPPALLEGLKEVTQRYGIEYFKGEGGEERKKFHELQKAHEKEQAGAVQDEFDKMMEKFIEKGEEEAMEKVARAIEDWERSTKVASLMDLWKILNEPLNLSNRTELMAYLLAAAVPIIGIIQEGTTRAYMVATTNELEQMLEKQRSGEEIPLEEFEKIRDNMRRALF